MLRLVKIGKIVGSIVIAFIFLYALIRVYSFFITPSTKHREIPYSEKEIQSIEQIRKLPEKLDKNPTVVIDIPEKQRSEAEAFFKRDPKASKFKIDKLVKEKKLPAWYPRNEAPVLAELVNEGKLPPVAERVGPDAIVEKGCDGIGKYGGTWLRVSTTLTDTGVIYWRLSYPDLFRFSPMIKPIVPFLAKSYKMLDNGKVWEITLRKIKWSDGYPVTADDLLFWWNDVMLDTSVMERGVPSFMKVDGIPGKIEKIGKYEVRFIFQKPYGSFLEQLANYQGAILKPKHYLIKYHPRYGDKKFIEREVKAYSLASPRALFNKIDSHFNPDCPSLNTWIIRKPAKDSPVVFVRNPYYYVVDAQGNQLPYIDRVYFEIVNSKMIPVEIANGKSTMQARYLKLEDYTGIASRSKEENTRFYFWISADNAPYWLICPNINRLVKKDQPATKWKAELLSDKKFRQALSIGVNRKEINKALYNNLGKEMQVGPGPLSEYYSPEWANAYINYNPDLANKMLDEIWRKHGLDPNKRVEGYRCTPDGKLLTFYFYTSEFTGIGASQFLVDQWGKLGLRIICKHVSRAIFGKIKSTLDWDLCAYSSGSEMLPMVHARTLIPYSTESCFAIGWGRWYDQGGFYGSEESKRSGCIPVPKSSPMYKAISLYQKAIKTTSIKKRKEYLSGIYKIAAENVWTINICQKPCIVVASKDMRNIPNRAVYLTNSPGNTGVETYFYEHPDRTAENDTVVQLKHVKSFIRYDGSEVKGSDTSQSMTEKVSNILVGMFILILILILLLFAFRHPFVLRRLFIMIPTLFIISICVFIIIQLPPGNFLDTYKLQLQQSGWSEDVIKGKIETLDTYFHFDDPAWKKYCRWMGFKWFATFKEEDKGLLQGDMGRSMESLKKVNYLIGDRIILTFLISLGTIIMTWLLAIPIGIYSACRQYTVGDYVFTFLGFIGMSLPGFLLALILMCLTGVSGLFSVKYLTQPYWDLPKVIDLLKHIWIPILIIGIGGTAGMIRVMRANLLDELKKPYVVTALAKGVRPMKLLFKYPVRVAINPFISGIGSLFPNLISGSAIVAIVLSLPTVGPLLFTALFNQDMLMAGSLLMALSTLSVLGTLVSDLLLITLDPRIRITGGKK